MHSSPEIEKRCPYCHPERASKAALANPFVHQLMTELQVKQAAEMRKLDMEQRLAQQRQANQFREQEAYRLNQLAGILQYGIKRG